MASDKYVVTKEMTIQGQLYKRGSQIDVVQLRLSDRKVAQLLDQRKIAFLK